MKKLLAVIVIVVLLIGCVHISGGVAPSNIPLAPNSYTELGYVRGIDCVYYLFCIIPLTNGNETKDALADALQQKPEATALINITADTYSMFFIVFSKTCTQVDGTAVKLK